MLIISSYGERDVRVGEDWELAVGLGGDRCALNVSVASEPNIGRRLSHPFVELSARVLVEHSLAECTELLPLKPTILNRW